MEAAGDKDSFAKNFGDEIHADSTDYKIQRNTDASNSMVSSARNTLANSADRKSKVQNMDVIAEEADPLENSV